jgi:hypothetical protein
MTPSIDLAVGDPPIRETKEWKVHIAFGWYFIFHRHPDRNFGWVPTGGVPGHCLECGEVPPSDIREIQALMNMGK